MKEQKGRISDEETKKLQAYILEQTVEIFVFKRVI